MRKLAPAQLRALAEIDRAGTVVVAPVDLLDMLLQGWLEWYGGRPHVTAPAATCCARRMRRAMAERVYNVGHCGECPAYDTAPNPVTTTGAELRAWSGVCRMVSRRVWCDDPERPEWCPLEKGPVLVRLRRG